MARATEKERYQPAGPRRKSVLTLRRKILQSDDDDARELFSAHLPLSASEIVAYFPTKLSVRAKLSFSGEQY